MSESSSCRHTDPRVMRIVSLVPSATETLFALGLGEHVAAVTHECDFPADARNLPKVTRDVIGPGLTPDAIDRAVRELTEQGRSIYELDEPALRRLAPDLIVTQALCDVCAVSIDVVQASAGRIDRVRLAVRAAPPVTVAALEWLDPVYVAGHWTPQLIAYAGGVDVLGLAGEHSET